MGTPRSSASSGPALWAMYSVFVCILVPGTLAHDDDWRKLADRLPPVEGPIWRMGDPVERGGGFEASGVTLLSWIPLNQFAGTHNSGNDCWGYTSPSGREYAIMGLERGFGFVEITDPINPVIIATIPGPTSLWHDVKVIGTYAYGVSEGGSGIQVMDLSQIDSGVVTLVRNWQSSGHSTTHNIIANEESGRLYICGANIGNGGLVHMNLSDPTRPAVNGGWTQMYVHDAQVVTWQGGALDGREIAFCASGFDGGFTQTGLRVVDLTNPTSPVTLATAFYPNPGYSHQLWLTEDRRFLYLNDELDEQSGFVPTTTTRIFNVENPASPVFVGTFTSGRPSVDHNLYTRDGFIFQANYRSGLRIFDGTDPVNPVEIAFFDTFPGSDSAQFNGAWSVYPYFESGTVIVSDIERGLFILSVPALTEPMLLFQAQGAAPEILDPAGGASWAVKVTARNTELIGSSVRLEITDANGTRSVQGTPVGGDVYSFAFPIVACGGASFVVRADASSGDAFSFPSSGAFSAAVVSEVVIAFADNFETDQGWGVSGNAADGHWERGIPVNCSSRGAPAADFDGSGRCYLTKNSAANSCNSDVDDGVTILTSPILDLSGGVLVSYAYWLNDVPNGALNNDALTVELSLDAGFTWTEVRRYESAAGSWRTDSFEVPASEGTAQGRVRFLASDLNPQNVVEAGVDAFEVSRIVCEDVANPCPADLAEPFGVLDLSDIQAFSIAFVGGDPQADLAEPFGVLDLADVTAFVQSFLAGCP